MPVPCAGRPGSSGTYTLSGGLLSVSELDPGATGGGTGILMQTGGLVSAFNISVGRYASGRGAYTLSGGESQRLKLVSHLAEAEVERRAPSVERRNPSATSDSRPSPLAARPTLFLFDEPTTGLHFDDVRLLLKVFQRLVGAGHDNFPPHLPNSRTL